VLHQLITS